MDLEPIKVEAWKALDGTIFLDYDRALRYNQINARGLKGKLIFQEKEKDIENYLRDKLENDEEYASWGDYTKGQEINLSFDSNGWDCNHKDNPTGKCIYEWSIFDEDCIFCGQPEERK